MGISKEEPKMESTVSIIPMFGIIGIFFSILGVLVTAVILMFIGQAVEIDNAEYVNCLIAVIIARVIRMIVFFILPFHAMFSLPFYFGAIITLLIYGWVISGVMSTSFGRGLLAAFLTMIVTFIMSFVIPGL